MNADLQFFTISGYMMRHLIPTYCKIFSRNNVREVELGLTSLDVEIKLLRYQGIIHLVCTQNFQEN